MTLLSDLLKKNPLAIMKDTVNLREDLPQLIDKLYYLSRELQNNSTITSAIANILDGLNIPDPTDEFATEDYVDNAIDSLNFYLSTLIGEVDDKVDNLSIMVDVLTVEQADNILKHAAMGAVIIANMNRFLQSLGRDFPPSN